LDDGYTVGIGFLSHFLKIEMSSLFVFEKRDGFLVAFEKVQEPIRALFKNGKRLARIFENSNEIQKLFAYPA